MLWCRLMARSWPVGLRSSRATQCSKFMPAMLHRKPLPSTIQHGLKRQASTSKSSHRAATTDDPKKYAFPERLLIYHAGTGRTTFLACLKLTTIFTSVFFCAVVAPAYLSAGEPAWKAAGVALCGVVPFAYVAWSTAPFVHVVHLHLPPFARGSREILQRFVRAAPADARLDVTTMSLIGKPRRSRVAVSELRPARRRLGMVNFVRDTRADDARRRWWMFRPVRSFNVQENNSGRTKEGWAWEFVADAIRKRGGAGP